MSAVEANWPLIIPPLLALIDDSSTACKVRGCSLLKVFLKTVPSQLLERTGLGEVFQSAIMPCLLYLPSLTPEEESLQLLGAVYPALLALVRARFDGAKDKVLKQKALDSIFRYGILKGHVHAGEHVKIAGFLVQRIRDLEEEMGIDSCKHLKVALRRFIVFRARLKIGQHVLPLLSSILSAPFATAYPPLLQSALQAIETIIVTNWPRIAYHRGEILKGLVVCWCRTEEEEEEEEENHSAELEKVRAKLRECVKLLTAVLERDVDVKPEYRLLIESDNRLEQLLVI